MPDNSNPISKYLFDSERDDETALREAAEHLDDLLNGAWHNLATSTDQPSPPLAVTPEQLKKLARTGD